MTRCIDCGGEIVEGEDHHCHTANLSKDWRAIEQQAQTDYQQIADDSDAVRYICTYFSKELQADYLKIYRSDRYAMNRSPKQAIATLLRLPPLQ